MVSLCVFGLGPYILVAAAEGNAAPASFMRWLTHHHSEQGLTGGVRGVLQVPRAFVGMGRLFFEASAGATALKSIVRNGVSVRIEAHDIWTAVRNLGSGTLLLTLAGIGFWLRRRQMAARLLLVATPLTTVFCVVWLGSDAQFWLPIFPALLGLSAMAVEDFAKISPTRRRLSLFGAIGFGFLLLASNLPTELPSPVTPGGSGAWARAARTAELLNGEDFVLAPGGPELEMLRLSRPGIETLALHQKGMRSGRAFIEYVLSRISAAQARGGRVYIDALTEPLPAQAVGWWELMQGHYNVSRGALKEAIEHDNRLVAADELGSNMQRIIPLD